MTKRKKQAGRPKGKAAKGKCGGLAPHQYLDDRQLKRLLRYVALEEKEARRQGHKKAITNHLIINLLVYAGLRASELCQLNIEDLPCHHKKDQVFVSNGKGKVSRTIDIPQSLTEKINRYAKLHRKGAKPNAPLFIGQKGKRLSYRGLYSRVKTIGSKVGLLDLHPHTLRHTYATRLYNSEQDLFNVKDQLGHKSADTTAIYAKTNNTARKRQAEKLDLGID